MAQLVNATLRTLDALVGDGDLSQANKSPLCREPRRHG